MKDAFERLEELLLSSSTAELSDADHAELNAILREDSEARAFAARFLATDALLADSLEAGAAEQRFSSQNAAQARHSSPYFRNLAALAACLVIGLCFALWWQKSDQRAFATIAHLAEAEWMPGQQQLSAGDRLSSQILQIESGIVRLTLDSGVEITLKGPAEFELLSVEETRLQSGILTATVPPGAEGFRVDTPTAEVIDLGTAFGIELREDGHSSVSVFDGEVGIVPDSKGDKRLLIEGESAQLAADGSVRDVEFSTQPFEKLWPTASGIAGSTGAFRFAPPWPRRLRFLQSNTEIFVLPEGYAKELEKPCPIDIAVAQGIDSNIPAGRRVRSFLLQFNSVEQEEPQAPDTIDRIEGSITFQRPILALIVESETLQASDERFLLRSGRVPQFKRGLELDQIRAPDAVSLSDDRRTLTLELAVLERLSDHVRVIVDAPLSDAGTP